jgi:hypothetical protein
MLENIIAVICIANTVAITFLVISYMKMKRNTLEDDGAADTSQEN